MWQDLNSFFVQNMQQLITTLIIPNLSLTNNEKYSFEDESASFVESFFQFSEFNSRKSVTVELLRNLAKQFPQQLLSQIQTFLQMYKTQLDQGQPFQPQTEIILLNLIIDGSTVCYRDKDGVSEIALPVELISFVWENIIKKTLAIMFIDLTSSSTRLVENQFIPIHAAYYLKFAFYFRNYIPKNEILELAKIFSYFLQTNSESLFGISAITVEGLLSLKEGDLKNFTNVKPYFHKDNIQPQIQTILANICLNARRYPSIEANLLKTLHFVILLMKEDCMQQVDLLCTVFKDQFEKLLGNQGYDFQKSFTLFESIGNIVQYANQANGLTNLENALSPYMNKIINKNITDLVSFVLQIYSIIIRNNENYTETNTYKIIFLSLIEQNNWIQENISVFPAYIVYISAYIYKKPSIMGENQQQLQQILTKCLQLKQDSCFFEFCRFIINLFDLNVLRQSGWLSFILNTSFQYYQQLKIEQNGVQKHQFVKSFVVFLCTLINKYSTSQLMQDFDVLSVIHEELPLLKNISDYQEKKIIFSAMCEALFQNTQNIGQQQFADILNALVENLGTRRYIIGKYAEIRENLHSMGGSGFQKISALKEKKILYLILVILINILLNLLMFFINNLQFNHHLIWEAFQHLKIRKYQPKFQKKINEQKFDKNFILQFYVFLKKINIYFYQIFYYLFSEFNILDVYINQLDSKQFKILKSIIYNKDKIYLFQFFVSFLFYYYIKILILIIQLYNFYFFQKYLKNILIFFLKISSICKRKTISLFICLKKNTYQKQKKSLQNNQYLKKIIRLKNIFLTTQFYILYHTIQYKFIQKENTVQFFVIVLYQYKEFYLFIPIKQFKYYGKFYVLIIFMDLNFFIYIFTYFLLKQQNNKLFCKIKKQYSKVFFFGFKNILKFQIIQIFKKIFFLLKIIFNFI
ncbi:karyopherin kap109, putative [Ichthyophthirius multifiliis]|uniref:Karyopherin kap109, putative n=1 Tax=Ichthyophthirius multifiliis TaxID=5932 RepID=G0R5V1_ICHMU|nr:karyopherin kap109, putative [Ichthyophthirius multifiliis]EGR27172.1 karyopherin kap109, putative [Ichthyophthirius multifiliis]|eukprot:XP_004024056.1 karyopherin kap109, putative [Ichthyophthirius multifiliis]